MSGGFKNDPKLIFSITFQNIGPTVFHLEINALFSLLLTQGYSVFHVVVGGKIYWKHRHIYTFIHTTAEFTLSTSLRVFLFSVVAQLFPYRIRKVNALISCFRKSLVTVSMDASNYGNENAWFSTESTNFPKTPVAIKGVGRWFASCRQSLQKSNVPVMCWCSRDEGSRKYCQAFQQWILKDSRWDYNSGLIETRKIKIYCRLIYTISFCCPTFRKDQHQRSDEICCLLLLWILLFWNSSYYILGAKPDFIHILVNTVLAL